MKKLFIFLFALICISSIANASQSKLGSCPFTDNFNIKDQTHPKVGDVIIQSLSSTDNLSVSLTSYTTFNTGCANNSSSASGTAYLSLSNSTGGTCALTISDGPYDMNPSVTSANCLGSLKYAGMDHVYSSYNYTLKFTS